MDINKQLKTLDGAKAFVKDLSIECRENLIEALMDESPYPNHKRYSDVWKKLSLSQKQYMKENISISADGKIEIIKMKKKFSTLSAEHNGKDVFTGEYEDKDGKIGIPGVSYLTGKAAKREAKKQKMKLLDSLERGGFIASFPGEDTEEKIDNIVELFGFEKSGYRYPEGHRRDNVQAIGFLGLHISGEDIYTMTRGGDKHYATKVGQFNFYTKVPMPYLAYEDC